VTIFSRIFKNYDRIFMFVKALAEVTLNL